MALQGEFLGIKPYKIMTITWLTQNVDFPAELVKADVEPWLEAVAADHGKIAGTLTYIFTDDPGILEVNRQFLQHDYFTDIILRESSVHPLSLG